MDARKRYAHYGKLICVETRLRRLLPEQDLIFRGFLGSITLFDGTSLRLIEMVTPDIAKAIEQAKTEIRLAEEVELIITSTRRHSVYCCGSGVDIRI